jgi:hypothetical protein
MVPFIDNCQTIRHVSVSVTSPPKFVGRIKGVNLPITLVYEKGAASVCFTYELVVR